MLGFVAACRAETSAVVVGIGEYGELGTLSTSREDAKAVAAALEESKAVKKEKIVLLTDDQSEAAKQPTFSTTLLAINKLAKAAKAEDTIFVFLSGYVIMTKGCDAFTATEGEKGGSISIDTIANVIKGSKAESKIIVFDTAHDGSKSRNLALRLRAIARDNKGITLINSCDAGEMSTADSGGEMSVFAKNLAEGIKGAADEDKNQTLTAAELFSFVKKQLEAWGKENEKVQIPVVIAPAKSEAVVWTAAPQGMKTGMDAATSREAPLRNDE